jgi:CBS domain containing-hemolysin-like protein
MKAGLSLALVFILALVSLGLTAIEAAFYLLKRRRLGHVALANARAEAANVYLDDPPLLLMPIQIGTYSAHVGMTVLVTSLLLDWMGRGAILVALLVMVCYLFVFRLTLPYALARRNPERLLLVSMPPFRRFAAVLSPVVRYLRRRTFMETEEEASVGATGEGPNGGGRGAAGPAGDEQQGRLVAAVERFGDVVVRNVMTPRPDMVVVPETVTVAEMRKILGETKFSRVPVYRENLDDIVGTVSVRDLVQCEAAADASIAELIRPVRLVPETKRVADLLRELQSENATLAVVIDEYGGTAGLVSMEDIVEELVGEIKDEYDFEAEPIVEEAEGAFLVDGRATVDRLEEALGVRLCDEDDVGTAGGLVAKVFGHIPRPGERAEHAGLMVEVVEADRRRVNRVRFRRLPPTEET